ncbi:MAG: phosphate-starvation-inducible PsiE family protein, partial [Chloroflexota bacterium]
LGRMQPVVVGTSRIAQWLKRAESVVLVLIAIMLIALAVILLGSSAWTLLDSLIHGTVRDLAIEILDSVLLVMMTMEIVYTVTVSLEGHTLAAEPFLIIGTIAAIRRMLVITAESTKQFNNIEIFRSTLIELGLLALIVVAIAVATYMLRRSQKFMVVVKDIENQS